MRKLLILLLSTSLAVIPFSMKASAKEAEQPTQLAQKALSAVLIEQDTGTILFDKNSDKKLPPASMTKIMTMLIIMEKIEKGALKLTDKVRTSEHAASMGGSQIFLEAGEEMTLHEMIKGIAIASGNDAAVAVAEKIAGTEEAFVEMMNKRAAKLGLKNTHFINPTGLPAQGHYSTAHDMAIMAQELLKHPLITKYTSIYEDYLRQNTDKKFWLVNTNKLVKFYPGVDGLKTGFTVEAKYCLTATAKKNGMRVIAVVMGAPTSKERNEEITKMLDFSFSQYKINSLYKKSDKIDTIKVSKGSKQKVDVIAKDNVSLVTKSDTSLKNVTKEIQLDKSVKAPVKKGEVLGKLVIKKGGKSLTSVPLIAKEAIDDASFLQLMKRSMSFMTMSNSN